MRKIVGVLSAGVLVVTVGCGSGSNASPATGGTANPTAVPGAMPGPDGGTSPGTDPGSGTNPTPPGTDGGTDGGTGPAAACTGPAIAIGATSATPGTLLADDASIYWGDGFADNFKGAIVAVAKSGGTATTIASGNLDPASKGSWIAIAADAASIYWGATNRYVPGMSSTLYRVAKTGGAVTTLATLPFGSGITDLVVDGGTIYLMVASDKPQSEGIYHVATTGGAVVQDKVTPGGALAQDASYLYVSSYTANTVKRIDKGGFVELVLASGLALPPQGIAADGARVYFDDGHGTVYAVDRNGGALATLHAGTSSFPVGGQLGLAAGRLFWREGANAFAGMNTDGSAFAVVDTHATSGAVADATFVYYTSIPDNSANESIMRACR